MWTLVPRPRLDDDLIPDWSALMISMLAYLSGDTCAVLAYIRSNWGGVQATSRRRRLSICLK